MDVYPESWSYRQRYLETNILSGPPHQGLERGFKVGKEEIAGLITALQLYLRRDQPYDRVRWQHLVEAVLAGVAGLSGVRGTSVCPERHPVPRAHLALDERVLGRTAFDVIGVLLAGTPRIAVGEGRAREGILVLDPSALRDEDMPRLVERLRTVLAGNP